MTNEEAFGWEKQLPKNDTIAMRLDHETAVKLAKMAWSNRLKTTRQAKLIFAEGMKIAEEYGYANGQVSAKTIPDDIKKDAPAFSMLIEKVSEHLTDSIEVNGKTFVYEPDERACLDFIISATELVMEKERREREAASDGAEV